MKRTRTNLYRPRGEQAMHGIDVTNIVLPKRGKQTQDRSVRERLGQGRGTHKPSKSVAHPNAVEKHTGCHLHGMHRGTGESGLGSQSPEPPLPRVTPPARWQTGEALPLKYYSTMGRKALLFPPRQCHILKNTGHHCGNLKTWRTNKASFSYSLK